jgi:hypothetical protein
VTAPSRDIASEVPAGAAGRRQPALEAMRRDE